MKAFRLYIFTISLMCLMPFSLMADQYSVVLYDGNPKQWKGWALKYDILTLCQMFPGLRCPAGQGYSFLDEPGYRYFLELQSDDTKREQKELEKEGHYGYIPPSIVASASGNLVPVKGGQGLNSGTYLFWYGYHSGEISHPFDVDTPEGFPMSQVKQNFYLQVDDESWCFAFEASEHADYALHIYKLGNELPPPFEYNARANSRSGEILSIRIARCEERRASCH